MDIKRPTDDLFVTFKTEIGPVTRHWQIDLPKASVCSSLRAQILAAAGHAAESVALELLLKDEELERQRGKLNPHDEDRISKTLLLLRNAQAGRALRGAATLQGMGPIESLKEHSKGTGEEEYRTKPGVAMEHATTALFDAVAYAVVKHGLSIRSEALFGVVRDGAIERAGLLYELAYASFLRLQWDSRRGDQGGRVGKEVNAVRENGMGVDAWANALDDVLISADELNLLFGWCVLHTFRPF